MGRRTTANGEPACDARCFASFGLVGDALTSSLASSVALLGTLAGASHHRALGACSLGVVADGAPLHCTPGAAQRLTVGAAAAGVVGCEARQQPLVLEGL